MHCLVRHGACGPSMLQHGPNWVQMDFKLLKDNRVT